MLAYSVRIAVLHGIIYYLLSGALYGQATSQTFGKGNNTENTTATMSPITTSNVTENATATISPITTVNATEGTTGNATENATATMSPITTAMTTPNTGCIVDCGENGRCVKIFHGYICECAFGFYNENNTCVKGKTFGGELTIEEVFKEEMNDKASKEHEKLLNKITGIFSETLKDHGYKSTVIINVRKGSVITDVTNTFNSSSSVTESVIVEALSKSYKYKPVYGCHKKQCDSSTTVHCHQPDYGLAECVCKYGFYKISQNETKCIESCDFKCKGKNQHCVPQAETHDVVCECQSGYKNNSGICESCPFGYNGINCEDGYELAITVTAIVCGVLILALVIALGYTWLRKRTESDEQKTPLVRSEPQQSFHMVSRNSRAQNRIPRVHLSQDDIDYDTNSKPSPWSSRDNDEADYFHQRPWNEIAEYNRKA
ncbi:mucin-13-like isoform X20 [Pristis pectinata]|uniref:mucin-13-like isoform X1 n=1 Tax=Pristis pectinata TaxID=685728 RepID=UPI00223E5FE9|nr:mucin-13-like isoform X1 [Pristis pectinata]XP_051884999.1 mucin-13-like isoform X2 [Pristis pectinata]XP_051885009.1 mucin-13-like isoform X3 [Pristis pectinata]XP_051885018.1 mucin-13-like isoform X4 [Pristis pectinata]XP_051885028.1 mucin-13-like isoform X5 [Pristis pectinata]XP_051885035.1 mucin-13-like isoform X6 [Pristis pectinata]XP_051885044.1 mucin-13-like isoform X7 [Pristis pectinata]XP_051885054.1 mucin-13-like isoform X8 [Pristis pectinata]XP_051885063.1 mucin-13-like isofor